MCNECKCKEELYDQCSILGHMPVGFCCPLCMSHEKRHDCENHQFTLVRTINYRFKMNGPLEEKEQEERATLIINKRGE